MKEEEKIRRKERRKGSKGNKKVKKKGKAVPLQAWTGPEGS